jgi:hypothetical protein
VMEEVEELVRGKRNYKTVADIFCALWVNSLHAMNELHQCSEHALKPSKSMRSASC